MCVTFILNFLHNFYFSPELVSVETFCINHNLRLVLNIICTGNICLSEILVSHFSRMLYFHKGKEISKVIDRSQGQPEGSLFISYYTEM